MYAIFNRKKPLTRDLWLHARKKTSYKDDGLFPSFLFEVLAETVLREPSPASLTPTPTRKPHLLGRRRKSLNV